MTGDCCVFEFLRRVDGKRLTRFQNENDVFKFLWRMDEAFVTLEPVGGKLSDRNNLALT